MITDRILDTAGATRLCGGPATRRLAWVAHSWRLLCVHLALGCLFTGPAVAQTFLVSVASDGTPGNGISLESRITPDGRFVVFRSRASNLVPGDTNNFEDIFVHDRTTGETSRVSVSSAGVEGNREAWPNPQISDDGRFVAFQSHASNLVPADTNGTVDIFVHDRMTAQTTRVSVSSSGAQGNSMSTDPAISADGRFVAFSSTSNNLVLPDLLPCCQDVYLHDRVTGQTTRVSVGLNNERANGRSYLPVIGAGGQVVAFMSEASNLVLGDTNLVGDVFMQDRSTGLTTRVNVSSAGAEANGGTSGPDPAIALSDDGRVVVFRSDASNLVPGDTNARADIFLHDRVTAQTSRVSISSTGAQSNGHSAEPAISGDGRIVGFNSLGSNLVAGDTNGVSDGFVHDRTTGMTSRINVSSAGAQSAGALSLDLTTDGDIVVFSSSGNFLVPGDTGDDWDVFVRIRSAVNGLPGAPVNLTVSVVGPIVTLSWSPPATGAPATSYVLEAGTVPGGSNVLIQDVGASLSLTAPAPNGLYYVRVRARNASGTGPPSNEVIVRVGLVCTAPPDAPGPLSVVVNGFTVSLAWGAAGGEPTTYVIEAGTAAGASNVATVDVGGLHLHLSAQAPAGTYYVRARARNACGTSAPTNEVTFAVGAPCVPPGAPGLLAASVAGNEVTLTWAAPLDPILSFVVEAGSASGASDLASLDTGSPQPTLTAVAPPGTYFVRVRGRNACGIGPAGNEIQVVVP